MDPVFLLLKSPLAWLPEDEWINVLGAVVKNPYSPTDNSVPWEGLRLNPSLLFEQDFDGFVLGKTDLDDHSRETTIRGLGKLRWSKGTGIQTDLSGKKIYIKRLKQHSEVWKQVSKSEDFQAYVPQWVNAKRLLKSMYQVCLVVGLLICQDVIVATSEEDARVREARLGLPLGTVTELVSASHGALIPTGGVGDVATGGSSSVVRRAYFAAEGSGKRIFAVQLMTIAPKKGVPIMTDQPFESSRQLGAESDGLDVDDLSMRQLNLDEWEELFEDEQVTEVASSS